VDLPCLSVGEYLNGQITDQHEKAQDAYLEIMQNLADIAFELLLDSGLAETGDTNTLQNWRLLGQDSADDFIKRIGDDWMDCLTIPEIPEIPEQANDALAFAQKHNELLQLKAQSKFATLQKANEFHEASVKVMGVAIHLALAMGTDVKTLVEHWIYTAKQHGAIE
jgi:hypothetical protein